MAAKHLQHALPSDEGPGERPPTTPTRASADAPGSPQLPPSILFEELDERFVQGPCIHELIDEQCGRTPDSDAVVDSRRTLNYAELKAQSDLLARHLQALGVARGDIVGSYMPHSAESIVANLAIFKAGGCIFPLETNYPPDLIAELVELSELKCVLTSDTLHENLPPEIQTPARSFLLHRSDDALAAAWVSELQGRELPALTPTGVGLEDRAYCSMTSGSTGKPKGVINEHIAPIVDFLPRLELIPYSAGDREAFNVFFQWEALRPLLQGYPAYVIPDDTIIDPKKLINYLEANQITRLMTTPTLLEHILDHDVSRKLKNIRVWLMQGEALPATAVHKFQASVPQAQMWNVYGAWECLNISYGLLDYKIDGLIAPVGRAMVNVTCYLLDEALGIVPVGEIGEIYVDTPCLGTYLDDPVKTAERFPTIMLNGKMTKVYKTGDAGRILPNGEMESLGRMDSTVKIRGFKVSIPFVESTIKEHPRVATAAIMPQMDASTNIVKSLAAYVVGKDGMMPETHLQELKDDLQQALPAFAFPQHWILLDQLPTKGGESRKLDRQALPPVEMASPAPIPDSIGAATKASSRREEVILECWSEVLSLDGNAISISSSNFFEVGGHSLLAAKLVSQLGSKYGINASVLDIYDHPTIATLAQHLGRDDTPAESPENEMSPRRQRQQDANAALAIVGMSGRFPGAANIEEFWSHLKTGHDALRRFTKEELISCGVPPEVYDHPDYVPAGQVCDDIDLFDAAFFGIGKLEAVVMDPQHRVFMEVAWHAMESAGYAPRDGTPTACGVFAASGIDGYLIHHLDGGALKSPLEPGDLFMTEVGSEKDYIATRVSYALNLHGPSMAINSACSSGLVAVAQAAQSIAVGACDMALAGASSLTFPNTGYLWEENLVYSRDGHVRPFDQGAAGTTFGDSVGAVVLKVLDDAVEDGDNIVALLSGSSVTNDGSVKAGYTAPAASGQRAAIVAAQKAAGVTARDVSYVECHATATNIGDGIELRGLTDAFASSIDKDDPESRQFCAIGSVKGNIGHANCAAGLTGLIKTVLCLKHRQLVPTAHFSKLNEKIDIRQDSPFYVHEGLSNWIPDGVRIRGPLTAGVSSFGIGGTNAHAVLREWTPEQRSAQLQRGGDGRDVHVLTASAKSPSSLKAVLKELADHVLDEANDLTDTAFTLHEGREEFPYRAAVLCDASDRASASNALRSYPEAEKCKANPSVVMCFPGQGSQYVNMGRGVYQSEPVYKKYFDACCELLQPTIGCDLKEKLFFDTDSETEEALAAFAEAFNSDPVVVQTSIFAVSYCLAKFLIETTGVKPIAMVGHSIGEYASAAVSGLMTLQDALGMVVARAEAMHERCHPGAMLSAKMPVEAAREYVSARSDVWLACENSPENVAFACSTDTVKTVTAELSDRGYKALPLKVTHGFHSAMVKPAADAVAAYAEGISMTAPEIPMVSNVSGGWMTDDDLTPARWAEHVTGTVRFVENVETVCKWKPTIFLEVGPGTSLCSLIGKSIGSMEDAAVCIPTMHTARDTKTSDQHALANMIAKLWSCGNAIDWKAYHVGERALRMPIPGYSFDKTSFWKNAERSIYVKKKTGPKKAKKTKKTKAAPKPQATANLVHYGTQSSAQTIKVYCFPFAGGSSSAFADWARECPEWMGIVAVELPGRGSSAGDPLPASHSDDIALVSDLARQIRTDFQASNSAESIAMVGLSMGVLLAIEIQQQLVDLPIVHSFLAGRAPVRGASQAAAATVLDKTSIDGLNLAPPEVTQSEAWEAHFLPMLLADLASDSRAASRLAATEKSAVIRGDIDIFCGLSDPSFPAESADQWRELAESASNCFDSHYFFGGHEFLKTCAEQIFGRIQAALCAKHNSVMPASNPITPRSSDMLSSVVWERAAQAPAAGLPVPQECCVLQLGAAEVEITEEHVTALSTEPGLVIMLTDQDAIKANTDTGSLTATSTASSEWIHEDETQCWRLLQIITQLADKNAAGRLTLVCDASVRGAMAVGASKSVPLEMPELFCQRIFIKNGNSVPDALSQALLAARGLSQETDLLVEFGRHQRRRMTAPTVFVSRLQPVPLGLMPAADVGPADGVFVSQASYIITGGLGGVGLALVDWLIDVQQVEASNIVIFSRRKHDDPTGPRGARVIQADVSDGVSLLGNDALRELGDVAGIFHLAGVLDDGLISSMTPERLTKTVQPKASGAMNLMNLAVEAGWDVEFMLCFSSTSSLGGYAGQANYCAANAVLDHLGQGWQLPSATSPGSSSSASADSMKMISVNFGPWGEAGMAAEGTRAHQLSLESGQIPMSNASGMRCIGAVLLHALSQPDAAAMQFAVCSCDWAATPWAGMPLLSHCYDPSAAVDVNDGDSGSDDDSDSGAPEQIEGDSSAVVAFMRDRVPGRWDLRETLSELGMDSLDTVQLRNGFNKAFSPAAPAKMALFTDPSMKLGELVEALEEIVE